MEEVLGLLELEMGRKEGFWFERLENNFNGFFFLILGFNSDLRASLDPPWIIRSLHQEFAMTDLGLLNYFLGVYVTRDSSGLFLSQQKYAVEILEKAHMLNCNPTRTLVDTESKLGVGGDPVCLYMHDPREPHLSALKRILRLGVPLLGDQLPGIVYFLATTFFLGPLSVNRHFLVLVQSEVSRAVSKPWRSFIDNSHFIAGYGTHDTLPHRLLLRYKDQSNEDKYASYVDETFTQQQDFTPYIPKLAKRFYYQIVIGSSHGLLCLLGYIDRTPWVVLWNPSIRRSVTIVVPNLTYGVVGFDVCPVTSDPIIVKISNGWEVQIFTLSSKRWRVVPCTKLPPRPIKIMSTQVVIDRCIYWVGYHYMIVSLDLIAEEFRFVDIPRSICSLSSSTHISISKIRKSLFLFVNNIDSTIWKMGHNDSFTKLFTFNTPERSVTKILGFGKNGEALTTTEKEDKQFAALEVYYPSSEHISNLGIYGKDGSFYMSSYKETLLLLNHSDGCVYPDHN
ncbi:F-box protein-like protein [Tanacetum coccineum]